MSLTFAVFRRFGRAACLAVVWAASLAALAPATSGCSDLAATAGPDDGDGPSDGTSVRFTQSGTLELKPRQVAAVGIDTSAGATLSVLILGDGVDASLDRSAVVADGLGQATVVLTAPSQPATFRLRAQLGDISAELPVSVSEIGFSSLRVVPQYLGVREIDAWVADVVVGSTCEAVLAKLPSVPGSLRASSGPNGAPLVESVPVGPQVVVALHAGPIAAGCTTLTLGKPGVISEVVVNVLDHPMVLEDAQLDVSLEFAPEPVGYQQILNAGANVVANAAFPPGQPLAGPLLDAIEAGLDPADLSAFQAHRETAQLDANLDGMLAGFDANAWCYSIASTGVTSALADAGSTSSVIKGELIGNPDDPTGALFFLHKWSGATPEDLGVPSPVPVTWSARLGDQLVVSAELPFSAARLAAHWMQIAATAQYGQDATVASSLAVDVDCEAIGALVGGFAECDATCGAALCEMGIARLWLTGLDSPEAYGTTTISLTAQAVVDSSLVPVQFSGSWAGTLDALGKSGSVAGAATGDTPVPD